MRHFFVVVFDVPSQRDFNFVYFPIGTKLAFAESLKSFCFQFRGNFLNLFCQRCSSRIVPPPKSLSTDSELPITFSRKILIKLVIWFTFHRTPCDVTFPQCNFLSKESSKGRWKFSKSFTLHFLGKLLLLTNSIYALCLSSP